MNQEGQFFRLGGEGLDLFALSRGQIALGKQGGIQQQIRDGSAGLMGYVGDEGLYHRLFAFYISPDGGGTLEEPGHSAFQRRQLRFVEPVFDKASGDSAVQHPVQPPEHALSGCPLPDSKSCPDSTQKQSAPSKGGHLPASQV